MMQVDMQKLLPELLGALSQGQELLLTGTGRSMYPFIDESRDRVVLSALPPGGLRPGNVYLYRRSNGGYCIHRLCRIAANGTLTFLGDRQSKPEQGILPEQVLAHVPRIVRDGSTEISFTRGAPYRKAVRSMRLRLLMPGHQHRKAVFLDYLAAIKAKLLHGHK